MASYIGYQTRLCALPVQLLNIACGTFDYSYCFDNKDITNINNVTHNVQSALTENKIRVKYLTLPITSNYL